MNKKIFPIGIGTWGVGGFATKDTTDDTDLKNIEGISYALQNITAGGRGIIGINNWYAEGHSVILAAKAIKKSGVAREQIFFHQSIYSFNNPTLKDIRQEMKTVQNILETDYMDSIEFDYGAFDKYGFDEVVDFLQSMLASGEAKFVSITNSNLEYLSRFKEIFGDKMFCHELSFNFEIRENEDWGIVGFAEKNNILNVVFQPLRRNRTAMRNWDLLVELADKYNKTQNQIIINWIVARGFLPLIKSSNINHIDENIAALDFELEDEDMQRLNEFRPKNWKTPEVVWSKNDEGDGKVAVSQLSNVFDDLCPEN